MDNNTACLEVLLCCILCNNSRDANGKWRLLLLPAATMNAQRTRKNLSSKTSTNSQLYLIPFIFGMDKRPVTWGAYGARTPGVLAKTLTYSIMKFDSLHCALLVAIVLLAVYAARDSGLFREGASLFCIPGTRCANVDGVRGNWAG